MGPGGEFVEDVAEIREGLDVIELTGLDQGINGRRPLPAGEYRRWPHSRRRPPALERSPPTR